MPINRNEVEFSAGGNRLAGTIHLPSTPPPWPGAVIVHGSGATGRDGAEASLAPVVAHLAGSGMAVLAYDKPGVGASSGHWTEQSFEDRARETRDAVAFLAAWPGVRPDAVGLWGISQGGWIAPMAAAGPGSGVAFVVVVSACPITPAEQVAWLLEHDMRQEGAAEREIAAALVALKERTRAMAGPASAARILADERRAYGDAPWYWRFESPPEEVDFMRAIWHFDPMPVLERLTCPVLAVWGALDVHMPVHECLRLFGAALGAARLPGFRLELYGGADHRIRTPEGDFAPGYLPGMTQWLSQVLS
ncbi:alpha/beta hydrolase family protein [Nonomuraea sediminis]|uniref:alpha/beta hydrolase family protein n=1 Tax=Nonomuraea sediminis TaxID=2835864 RepID=UPI001BDC942F|nr:alpha/beta fold hydrolase [Nonomuraea sediminis]